MNKFGQGVWAVGGGATGFGGFSPCISITSVQKKKKLSDKQRTKTDSMLADNDNRNVK